MKKEMKKEMRLIDANALKDALSNLEASGGHKYYRKGMDDTLHFHMPNIIDDAPTVDAVEVVHGRWVMTLYTTTSKRGRVISNKKFTCSVCGYCNGRKQTNYCPNCGAKMDKNENP